MSTAPGPLPEAGWYTDPNGQGKRYWDGQAWTEHHQADETTPTAARVGGSPNAIWGAAASALAMAIGALGPWATALGGTITISGTSGQRDGWIVLGLSVIAGMLIVNHVVNGRSGRTVAVLLALIAAGVCVVDLLDITNKSATVFGQNVQVVSAAWGIYLALAGSIGLAIFGALSRHRD